jgi:hypothetical protein
MVPVRSKWSLRPAWRRRVGRPGVVGGSDTTRRQPAQFGLPSTTPAFLPRKAAFARLAHLPVIGARWLLWKDEANTLGHPSSLWQQALTADGLGLAGTRAGC